MAENNINRIKTSQSEIEKEEMQKEIKQKYPQIPNPTVVSQCQNYIQNKTTYHCTMCQRDRIICPCETNHQKYALAYTFHKQKQNQRKKRVQFSQSTHEVSRSVPKITFTYNQTQSLRQRNHSFSIPKATTVDNQWVLRDTQTTMVAYPLEEILYYPVVHNKFKYESPRVEKVEQSFKRQANSSRKRIKRSYIDNSIKAMKDISTNESKEPMTPEQFKRLSQWLLQK